MKKIFQRLIVFFVGLPALIFIIVFLPQYNHFALNVVVIVFSVLGALELRNILSHKNLIISLPETIILGALSPVVWTVAVSFSIEGQIIAGALAMGTAWLLISRIFVKQEQLDSCISRIAAGLAVMVYPGLFLAWIVQMAVFNQAGFVILIFFLIALLNDAIAWAAGNLFGKNNRGLIAASPGKSISGFIGGLAASVGTGIAAVLLIPGAFSSAVMPSLPAGMILGFGAGIAATLGDLGESAIKRSAGVKDSGALIMGRGGALDSIDSLALAAPVYYILYSILFHI